jgi:hypothetical protein
MTSIFVVMPFSPEYRDLYELGIKAACEKIGANCSRVDEQIFLESILDRIYRKIQEADFVIADLSDQGNPNVYYETGYAHGIGKRVILLTKDAQKIPFDLRHYPHLVYQSISDAKQKLERTLSKLIENPNEFVRPGRPDDEVKSDALMTRHILNYLEEKGFNMMSFEEIRARINPNYSDDALCGLIDRSPDAFRRARLKGSKPGIARLRRGASRGI